MSETVDHREDRDRSRLLVQSAPQALDHLGCEERTSGVVDEDVSRGIVYQRLKADAHGVLPVGTTYDKPQIPV
jgi:hypothetical protein